MSFKKNLMSKNFYKTCRYEILQCDPVRYVFSKKQLISKIVCDIIKIKFFDSLFVSGI